MASSFALQPTLSLKLEGISFDNSTLSPQYFVPPARQRKIMSQESQAPTQAKDAVLVQSAEMPAGSQKVEELDFNKFRGRPITAEDLLDGMRHMGFQASSMCEAVRIINDMVS